MTKTTIGLDVGGAHLKLARVEDGRVVSVRQIACPLWEGIERLDSALHEVDASDRRCERLRRHDDS